LIVLGIVLGSCDVADPGIEPASEKSKRDSVRIFLLEPGRVVTGLEEPGPLRLRDAGASQEKPASHPADMEDACTMTLYRPDGPGYYTRSAELAYPDSVKEKAGGPPSSECAFA